MELKAEVDTGLHRHMEDTASVPMDFQQDYQLELIQLCVQSTVTGNENLLT